ncbi:hypothetical protein B0H17DRAFT_470930 [Mycena rosella]|uniref:Uncharacterized protein n=1 Tax=Mycena rosella TaxID=1033263 RepID=A0AAD7GGQ7_MYCRO|nr:hypothetical protein B0H17DRAFT_470930 [Mycena rosella]
MRAPPRCTDDLAPVSPGDPIAHAEEEAAGFDIRDVPIPCPIRSGHVPPPCQPPRFRCTTGLQNVTQGSSKNFPLPPTPPANPWLPSRSQPQITLSAFKPAMCLPPSNPIICLPASVPFPAHASARFSPAPPTAPSSRLYLRRSRKPGCLLFLIKA